MQPQNRKFLNSDLVLPLLSAGDTPKKPQKFFVRKATPRPRDTLRSAIYSSKIMAVYHIDYYTPFRGFCQYNICDFLFEYQKITAFLIIGQFFYRN